MIDFALSTLGSVVFWALVAVAFAVIRWQREDRRRKGERPVWWGR